MIPSPVPRCFVGRHRNGGTSDSYRSLSAPALGVSPMAPGHYVGGNHDMDLWAVSHG